MTIEAPYQDLMRWLHNPDVLLGEFIVDGHRISGDIGALSALEGIVSAPAKESAESAIRMSELRSDLLEYSRCRESMTTIESLIEIAAVTERAG